MSFEIPRKFIEADGLYKKGYAVGLEEGRKIARQQHEKEQKLIHAIRVIRNMVARNYDVPIIADIVQLSQESVLKIKTHLEKEPEILVLMPKANGYSGYINALNVMPLVKKLVKKLPDL